MMMIIILRKGIVKKGEARETESLDMNNVTVFGYAHYYITLPIIILKAILLI
jgi:hypothetical protein